MADPPRIRFFDDEHLPFHALGPILTARGHQATPVQIGAEDPAILVTADQVGAVIVTADAWFLRESFRLPTEHRRRSVRAGVVQLPGEWSAARQRILDYLPIIEMVYQRRRRLVDQRLGIDLAGSTVRITDPRPGSPRDAGQTRRAST
jgi:hypothetical protein